MEIVSRLEYVRAVTTAFIPLIEWVAPRNGAIVLSKTLKYCAVYILTPILFLISRLLISASLSFVVNQLTAALPHF